MLRNLLPKSARVCSGIEQSVPHECEQIFEFFVREHDGIGNARIEPIKQGLHGAGGAAEIGIETAATVSLERRAHIQVMANSGVERHERAVVTKSGLQGDVSQR